METSLSWGGPLETLCPSLCFRLPPAFREEFTSDSRRISADSLFIVRVSASVSSSSSSHKILVAVPSLALGTPPPVNGYIPLFDDTIPPADRGPTFVEWGSSYYVHGDVSTRNAAVLNARTLVPGSRSTVSSMSHEELMSVIDMAPADRSELFFLSNPDLLTEQMHQAISEVETRALWPNAEVCCVYGDHEPWNVFYGAWEIEKSAKSRGAEVKFFVLPGTNHFERMLWYTIGTILLIMSR